LIPAKKGYSKYANRENKLCAKFVKIFQPRK